MIIVRITLLAAHGQAVSCIEILVDLAWLGRWILYAPSPCLAQRRKGKQSCHRNGLIDDITALSHRYLAIVGARACERVLALELSFTPSQLAGHTLVT